jgi:sporulation protein YlmC with PRC-barrel domain
MSRSLLPIVALGLVAIAVPALSMAEITGEGAVSREGGAGIPAVKEREMTGAGSMSQRDATGTQSMATKDYLLLAVPQTERTRAEKHSLSDSTVKDLEGKPLGTLERIIMDSKTGKVEYGVLSMASDDRLIAVPWNAFKVNRETGNVRLNLTRDEMNTYLVPKEFNQLSPSLKELMTEIEQSRVNVKNAPRNPGSTFR